MTEQTFPVLQDDTWIRPAGDDGGCVYCQRKVGQNHGPECVRIVRRVTYAVRAEPWGIVAMYTSNDPSFWGRDMCEFHKNESSWCKGNLLELDDDEDLRVLQPDVWAQLTKDDECLCDALRLEPIELGGEVFRAT